MCLECWVVLDRELDKVYLLLPYLISSIVAV